MLEFECRFESERKGKGDVDGGEVQADQRMSQGDPLSSFLEPLNICQHKRDDELPLAAYAIKTTASARAPAPCQCSSSPLLAPQPKGVLSAASTSTPTMEATEQRAHSPRPDKFHRVADASPSTRSLRSPRLVLMCPKTLTLKTCVCVLLNLSLGKAG